jgi:hypothetical protein
MKITLVFVFPQLRKNNTEALALEKFKRGTIDMKITIDAMYDSLLLFIGCVVGVIATIFILNYAKIEPLQIEKKRVAAVNEVITNASFRCGMWKVEEKVFDREGNLLYLTLTAPNRNDLIVPPLDLRPDLRRAWNKKRKGDLVEVIIPSWLIREYLEKGGNSPRAIDLIAPDSIDEVQ